MQAKVVPVSDIIRQQGRLHRGLEGGLLGVILLLNIVRNILLMNIV